MLQTILVLPDRIRVRRARRFYVSLIFSLRDMASCVCPLKLSVGGSSLESFCAEGSRVGCDAESVVSVDGSSRFSDFDCAARVFDLRSPDVGSSMFSRCASGSCEFVVFSADEQALIVEDIALV